MENMNIKDHPPWYARGTPVMNTRDGPAMALSDKPFLVISRKPSARGEGEECMNALICKCMNEEGRRNPDKFRGEQEKTRRWLTLKTTFFNMRNNVFSHWYALL